MSKLYKKVAKRYIESREYSVNPVIQENVSGARTSLNQLEEVIERGIQIINESEKKEHIYSEAGDMILNVTGIIKDLKEKLLSLSYFVSKKEFKNVKNRVPAEMREEIDDVIKHSSIAEKVADKYRENSSDVPHSDFNDLFQKGVERVKHDTDQRTDEGDYDNEVSKGEKENQKDVEEYVNDEEKEHLFMNQDGHENITDWSQTDIGFNKPKEIPDDIRFH